MITPAECTPPPLCALKRAPLGGHEPGTIVTPDDDQAFSRIRCPRCDWQPARSSMWCCLLSDGPEPFDGCGTTWNTFLTRGRCPGCQHVWRWTRCLRCHGWSLHERWYTSERRNS